MSIVNSIRFVDSLREMKKGVEKEYYRNFIHITHTDLDGVSCSLVDHLGPERIIRTQYVDTVYTPKMVIIFYFLHNYIKSSTTYNQIVTQFSFGSNMYETGTILCLPSATSNLTKMYSSSLITLNYGIYGDDVYYQAADGLHKQDAAIIKDGVVTDI